MSTQLILYPQTYQGQYSSMASPSTIQYIVNGISFTGFNSTSLHNTTAVHPSQDAISNAPPTLLGNWYRFTTTGGDYGAVTAPTYALGAVQLSHNAVTPGQTGFYQKLSQLIVGAIYDVKISIVTPQAEILTFEMWDGTVIHHQAPLSANTSTITTTFTAQSSNDIFLIYYEGISANLSISKISILQSPISPSLIYTELEDGQVICDLYQEEDIPLSLSIDDFKNVAEKVQSYSKDFNLPATKRNNRIFNNMFEVTRTAQNTLMFNPYVKTKCVLKEDGFILFEGYLRLINVKDKEGEISYNVNLYSEVIALADTLKGQTFANLDFEELAHLYNKTSIKYSWYNTVGLPLENSLPASSFAYDPALGFDNTNVLKYPFIDWNHQYIVGGTNPIPTNATPGNPELTALEQAFRPCIQLKYLINKIFAASGFNWTSNFFDSTDFGNLFMDFNWGSEDTPNSVDANGWGRYNRDSADNYATTVWTAIDIDVEDFEDEFGFDVSTGVFTCPSGQDNATFAFGYHCVFRCASTTSTQTAELELRWLFTPAGGTPVPIDATPIISMDSSASGDIDTAGSAIDDINIFDGGYYASAPTVTVPSVNGTGAVLVAVGPFPGPVTSVTVTTGGYGYNYQDDIVFFNSVNPLHLYIGQIQQNLNVGDTLQLQFKANANNMIRQNNQVSVPEHTSTILGFVTLIGITDNIMLQTLRGETGQWEFLKGIFTMFNLITMVDESNPDNILIEPYADVFINNTNGGAGNLTLADRGIQHDWTDKVDVSQMELKPLTDLNKTTIFKFVEDDEDYVFNQYKNSTTGHLYGSKEIDASTASNGMPTIFQGTKEIKAEPFAATVSKPLDFQFPDFITPSIYALTDDGTSEGFDNSPRIFYNNGRINTGASYYIPEQNGLSSENQEWILQFSHLSSIPVVINTANDTRDFVFESQQLFQPIAPDGPPTDNLYSMYWQPYFNELYNPDTRAMTLKVNLSPSDVASFKFYDTVFIKNRVFRVNKIGYKPNDLATVEFILIP
tara:strand:+ start:1404 stop:4454 length:3051 start_codon:yes stop_codon:yes gene_type:complete